MANKLGYEFYHRPCLEVAQDLVGKVLIFQGKQLRISETEAYCGVTDTACHAHKGRTKRTEVMYMEAGTIYIYLCYGVHWLLNIVTGGGILVDDEIAIQHEADNVLLTILEIVAVGHKLDLVCTCVKLIALITVLIKVVCVVSRHIVGINGDSKDLALAGVKGAGLCKAHEVNVCLLNLAGLILGSEVYLNNVLACIIANVFNRNLNYDLAVSVDLRSVGDRNRLNYPVELGI